VYNAHILNHSYLVYSLSQLWTVETRNTGLLASLGLKFSCSGTFLLRGKTFSMLVSSRQFIMMLHVLSRAASTEYRYV
jgi:hypothetical protein